ncbi:uncharacterized protein G2W53_010275 [Senna tora]|uniref:Uncharacterized protein n=1 Tax=Senna tora TaxID=362788 RepID=A0A834WZL1_9FABA|nr:uncharacterized protein G2W53_010275 [Senna tora]
MWVRCTLRLLEEQATDLGKGEDEERAKRCNEN